MASTLDIIGFEGMLNSLLFSLDLLIYLKKYACNIQGMVLKEKKDTRRVKRCQ